MEEWIVENPKHTHTYKYTYLKLCLSNSELGYRFATDGLDDNYSNHSYSFACVLITRPKL